MSKTNEMYKMIDTDKYKDAQKQAWRDAWGQPYFELNEMQRLISDNGPNSCNNSDVELWADAPLLLAEVKRLREEVEQLREENEELQKAILLIPMGFTEAIE